MTDESVYALTSDTAPAAGSIGFNARRVVCPGCNTRYLVADEAFGPVDGRRIRCADCGHCWQYSPAPGALQPSFLDEVATAKAAAGAPTPTLPSMVPPGESGRPEPTLAAEPLFAGPSAQVRPSVLAERQRLGRHPGIRATFLGGAVLAAGLVLIALLAREPIRALYPRAGSVYTALGFAEAARDIPGAGLKVTVTPTRSQDALVINGEIVNSADIPRSVPRLRLTLVDGNKSALATKVISPPVSRLGPGGTAQYNAIFEHPANAAVRVNVSFAKD